jgi:hypothetical protein
MKTSPKQATTKSTAKRSTKSAPTRGIPTTFWIQAEDLQRLKQFATEHQLSASNVINRALRRLLADGNPFFRP